MADWRDVRGLSLADLLVAMAVLGVLLAGCYTLLVSGVGAWRFGSARVEAQQSARLALEHMAKELREAGYDPAQAGIQAVVTALPDRVTFQRDLNGNGVVDPTRERVTWLVRPAETILRRDAGGGAQPVAERVRRFQLSYSDRAGMPTADPRRVSLIRIELEVGRGGPGAVMETSVALRNSGG